MKRIFALIALVVGHAGNTYAEAPSLFTEGGTNALLATKQAFSIRVNDQAKDGCLPRPNHLKDAMEISLRKNGFDIVGDTTFGNEVTVTALGYGFGTSGSSCAIYLSVNLGFLVSVDVPHTGNDTMENTVANFSFPVDGTLLTGPKNSMQERLEKGVAEAGDRLFLQVSRARDDIFSKFPAMKTSFERQ